MSNLRIFVVDDDADVADALAEVLELNGHEVKVAYDSQQAIDAFQHEDFDLAFMDVMMPGKNGVESFIEIKKFKPSAEEKKGFYAELPIALEVSGSYHQLATFISGIAALPRIVTISDMKLEPFEKEETSSAKLKMSATAKTYRYLQEDEQ